MSDPALWKTLYEARAERLRELAQGANNEVLRLAMLWAAHDYDLMADGKEPDESNWRP